MKRALCCLFLAASCGTSEAVISGGDDTSSFETALSSSQKRERSEQIKAAAAQVGVSNALVVAGIANHESGMAQCWSEASWHCQGPYSPDCGGPALAGSGDGACGLQRGGLGMFQLDSGNHAQTVAAWGQEVLSVAGNVQAGIEMILYKLQVCPNTRLGSVAAARDFLNRARPGTPEFETFLTTMAWCYNGCAPSYTSCSHQGVRASYRAGVSALQNAFGPEFWSAPPAVAAPRTLAMGSGQVGANADGRLELFARGTDGAVWIRWQQSDGSWSGWVSLGGESVASPAVASTADGRLEVFALAPGGALQHRWQTGGGWNEGWHGLGGWNLEGTLSVAKNADGRLEVFGRTKDGHVWHAWQWSQNKAFSDWAPTGGDALHAPVVAQNADGRLELFITGLDGAVWHRWQWQPGNDWSGWSQLGGQVLGRPAVARAQTGALQVFVRGADGRLYVNGQSGGSWSGFRRISHHEVTTSPAAGLNADGRLEVFARAPSGELLSFWEASPGGAWHGPANLGGQLIGDAVQVARNADGRLEVFAQGADGQLWHSWQLGTEPGFSGWAATGFWPDGF